jgi:hypothetical protein
MNRRVRLDLHLFAVIWSTALIAALGPGVCSADPSPDLRVVEFAAPDSLLLGQVLSEGMMLQVGNQGDADSPSFSVGIYLSIDDIIAPDDMLLENGRRRVSALDAHSVMKVDLGSWEMRIPDDAPLGDLHIGALVDDLEEITEADEGNNQMVSPTEVVAGEPNLYVVSFSGPATAGLGESVGGSISLTIGNNGEADAGQFSVGLYLSPDVQISPWDDLLVNGRKTVYSLQAGATLQIPFDAQVKIPTDSALGSQYIGVLIDDMQQISEKFESDNDSSSSIVVKAPDLKVDSFACERYSAGPGQTIGRHVKARIVNNSQVDGIHGYKVVVYLSTDPVITAGDTPLINGEVSLPPAPAGSYVDVVFSSSMSIPSGIGTGSLYIGVLADVNDDELEENEGNNYASQTMAITTDTWTIMGYFDGDCNREWQALDNMDQMEYVDQAGVPINLVALVDRHPKGPSGGYSKAKVPSSGGSDWSDTRWGPVIYDGKRGSFATSMYPLLPATPELNVATNSTLEAFVKKMMEAAPAQHYALIIYDHGSMGGIARDDTSNDSGIGMPELRAAFAALPHIDIVILDACLMQDIEVATEMIGEIDYLMASQSQRFANDIHLEKSLKWLEGHPSATPAQLAQSFFTEDTHHTVTAQQGCVSVLDMNRIPQLNQLVDSFANAALASATASDWSRFRAARSGVTTFAWNAYLDLREYMTNVAGDSGFPSALRTKAQAVVNQLSQVVIHQKGAGYGLTINLPEDNTRIHPGYNGNYYSFVNTSHANGTHWRDFLAHLPAPLLQVQAVVLTLTEDWGDDISTALPIEAAPGQFALIDSAILQPDGRADLDFFLLDSKPGFALYASVQGDPANGGIVPVLTLYGPDGKTVVWEGVGDDSGYVSMQGLRIEMDGPHYLRIASLPAGGTERSEDGAYSLSFVMGDAAALAPELVLEDHYLFVGEFELGSWGEAVLRLTNVGGTALEIGSFDLPDDSAFRVPSTAILLPIVVGPGESFDLPVGVKIGELGSFAQPMMMNSNDPIRPQVEVVLEAVGVPDPCPGDHDGDEDVDGAELAALAADMGREECNGHCAGDFSGDDRVDEVDVAIFAENYGRTICIER